VARFDDPNLNAAVALEVIESVSREIQSTGWWFNEEGSWFLTPDSNGEVRVPNNALDITAWNGSRDKSLTIRGTTIYNTITHSTDLRDIVNADGKIELRMIFELPFEHLPPIAQVAISDKAVRKFAQDIDGDVNKWRFNTEDEKRSMALLYSAESANTKRNAMQNPVVQNFLARAGGVNSLSSSSIFPEKWRQQ
jgi:hypothetical protein